MIYNKYNSIAALLRSRMTVFSNEDLALLWGIENRDYLKAKVYRLIKSGQLMRIKNGLFCLDLNYNQSELANKLITPSYISFETILAEEGVIFQSDSSIYSASNQNRTVTFSNRSYIYRKIKDNALLNNIAINSDGCVSKAIKERAIVDILYLKPEFYFDNLSNINWDFCLDIAQIFQNKALINRIKKLKEQNA